MGQIELPDKLFFKIGEVAKIAGVRQHVLRYWESEFAQIRPQKSKTNQRLYRRRDVEAVLAVKHLLYDRKFTIEGARQHLKKESVGDVLPKPGPEEVAARTREEVLREAEQHDMKMRAQLIQRFQKDLLSVRKATDDFLKQLEAIEGSQE